MAVDPARRARVNRDLARVMLHGRRLGTREQERQVSIVCHGAVLDLLRAGVSVVEDGTNLPDEHLVALWDIADRAGARFRVADFTRLPVEVCVARDARREGAARLGRQVIEGMCRDHLGRRRRPLRVPAMSGTHRGNLVEVVDMTRPGAYLSSC